MKEDALKTNRIIHGNNIEVMRKFPEESIHMVITSSPFWGLRDYGEGTETIWGGDEDCEHEWGKDIPAAGSRTNDNSNVPSKEVFEKRDGWGKSHYCQKCGAWKGQLGLEPTFEQFISNIVSIFKEIKRILRPDGSVYLNLGDTYAGSGGAGGDWSKGSRADEPKWKQGTTSMTPKCKILIPHRVAIALIDDGWIIRNDILWRKLNPMPSSVKDRLSNTFEFIFHLVKNKKYYYDLDAIREPHKTSSKERAMRGNSGNLKDEMNEAKFGNPDTMSGKRKFSGYSGMNKKIENGESPLHPSGKNPGDVFNINTVPFSGTHFATFPRRLCMKPIRSSCPPKVCRTCGTPYEKDIEREKKGATKSKYDEDLNGLGQNTLQWERPAKIIADRGWKKQCDCDTKETEPGIVLDPFSGAGTTAIVAKELGRRWIGIEISEEYADLSRTRIARGDKYIRKLAKMERRSKEAGKKNHSLEEWG